MVKKILGGALVASALLLTSCGYSAEEQKFYDACVAEVDSSNAIKSLKEHFKVDGDSAKKVCAAVIEEANKLAKKNGASADQIKAMWKDLADRYLSR